MSLLLVALVLLAVLAVALVVAALGTERALLPRWAVRPEDRTWTSDTLQRAEDGAVLVVVRRAGEAPRTVRELPPGADPVDHRLELEDALREADAQARVLNREG